MIGPERGQKKPIRVFLVDDHAVVRDGVRRLIDDEADLTVTGEAGGGVELLAQLATLECDVLVLDLSMPGRPGFDVLREVKAMRPDIRVLILSVYPESQYAASLLHAGAHGYLSKGRSSRQLLAAIRTVALGKSSRPPRRPPRCPAGCAHSTRRSPTGRRRSFAGWRKARLRWTSLWSWASRSPPWPLTWRASRTSWRSPASARSCVTLIATDSPNNVRSAFVSP